MSKAYPTEADVWKHASENGLVVDVSSDAENLSPKRVLDSGYEIKSCDADPPAKHDPAATDIELPLPLTS